MNDLIILKTNLIGGVDKQQVVDYITDLQAQLREHDLAPEIKAAEIKIRTLHEEINRKDGTLCDLRIKLEELNSFEARLEGALEFIQAIPENSFRAIFKNQKAKIVFERINKVLSINTAAADKILPEIDSVNTQLEKISSELQSVLMKLDNVHFDDKEISLLKTSTTVFPEDAPSEFFEDEIATFEELIPESLEEEQNYNQPEDFENTAETVDYYELSATDEDDADPLFENSVDNFFAELEKLMNK